MLSGRAWRGFTGISGLARGPSLAGLPWFAHLPRLSGLSGLSSLSRLSCRTCDRRLWA